MAMFSKCFGSMLGVRWGCFGDVLAMFWACCASIALCFTILCSTVLYWATLHRIVMSNNSINTTSHSYDRVPSSRFAQQVDASSSMEAEPEVLHYCNEWGINADAEGMRMCREWMRALQENTYFATAFMIKYAIDSKKGTILVVSSAESTRICHQNRIPVLR